MRLRSCRAAERRLRRASALHRLSDAGVKRAALDQVERSHDVRTALAALLAQMDGRPTDPDEQHGEPHALAPHVPPLDPA